jgi:hypothetical protein
MIVTAFGSHLNVDLQQRAIEFGALCRSFDHLRGPILERMPPIPSDRLNKRGMSNGDAENNQNDVADLLLGDVSGDNNVGDGQGDSVMNNDTLIDCTVCLNSASNIHHSY